MPKNFASLVNEAYYLIEKGEQNHFSIAHDKFPKLNYSISGDGLVDNLRIHVQSPHPSMKNLVSGVVEHFGPEQISIILEKASLGYEPILQSWSISYPPELASSSRVHLQQLLNMLNNPIEMGVPYTDHKDYSRKPHFHSEKGDLDSDVLRACLVNMDQIDAPISADMQKGSQQLAVRSGYGIMQIRYDVVSEHEFQEVMPMVHIFSQYLQPTDF